MKILYAKLLFVQKMCASQTIIAPTKLYYSSS